MRQTVVGVFDRCEEARRAAALLRDSGFGSDAVHVTESTLDEGDASTPSPHGSAGIMENIRSFFAEVFGAGEHDEVSAYAEAVRRGGAVVKVDVDDDARVDIARDTLQTAGAIDIEERAAEWRQAGWGDGDEGVPAAGAASPASATGEWAASRSATRPLSGDEVLPSAGEGTAAGARAGMGGVRVYPRAAGSAAASPLGLHPDADDFERYSEDFESDYRSRYAALGGRHEEYMPAYRYGHSMARDGRYAGRPWDEVEPVLRSDWEQRHPESTWERFKGAVRHAWERVTG